MKNMYQSLGINALYSTLLSADIYRLFKRPGCDIASQKAIIGLQ